MPAIILSDNGVSSGSAGLKTSGSNDGTLALQTSTAGGTATTAVTINTSQNVGIGETSPATRLSFGDYIPSNGQTLLIYQNANTRSGLGVVSGIYRMFTDSGSVLSFGGVSTSDGSTYTERMRINASGNIGVGVTPSAWESTASSRAIQFNATSIYSYRDSNTLISQNGYYDGTWKYYNTGPTGRINMYQDQITFDAAASGTQNNAISYTTIFTVGRGSTFALQSGTSTNGTGIAFPSTVALSSNANTLDDYEEGTWNPQLNFGGVACTNAASFGLYTKIGRVVTLTGYLTINNKNGGSGSGTLTGLPFSIANDSKFYPGGYFGYFANSTLPAGSSGVIWYGGIGTSTLQLGTTTVGGWDNLNATYVSSTFQLGPWTIVYVTDQ